MKGRFHVDFVACSPWMPLDYTDRDFHRFAQFYGTENICPTCCSNNNGIINGPFPLTIKQSCSPQAVTLHQATDNILVTEPVLTAINAEGLDVDVIPATVKGKTARPRYVLVARVTATRWFTDQDITAVYQKSSNKDLPLRHHCDSCGRIAYRINNPPLWLANRESLQGFGDYIASPEQFNAEYSEREFLASARLGELLRRFDKKTDITYLDS